MKTHHTAVSAIVAEIQELCDEARIDEKVRRGPVAVFKPSFIVTLLILKNLYGFSSERSFLRYVTTHHIDLFPQMPERSWFNRTAKKLIDTQKEIHRLLLEKLRCERVGIRIVDTNPLPVVKLHRARRCTSFEKKAEVNFGYCASKKYFYYGEKLALLTTAEGIPTEYVLTPANVHDVTALKQHLRELRDINRKKLIGDNGYYDGELAMQLKAQHRTRLIVPDKKRHRKRSSIADKRLLRKRGIIERVTNQLQDHMHIDETRAKSHTGLITRIQSALLAFTFGFYFNCLSGNPPLALKSILV